MSTFGKVLAGLVLVMFGVWFVLVSGVAQLNKNYEETIAKIEKQQEQAADELATVLDATAKAKDEFTQAQVGLGQELALRRAKQAEVEQMRSSALTDLARAKNLQATSEATQKDAEHNRDERVAERKAEEDGLMKEQGNVKELQATNVTQMARLQELREQFVALQQGNLAKIRRLSQ